MHPGYLDLHATGELQRKAETAVRALARCTLCPRHCKVDRTIGEKGICGIGRKALVASYGPHFGEEQPLVGTHGSGTIFFTGCSLHCVFCQNVDISRADGEGIPVTAAELGQIMLKLQARGCHNINLVTPGHVVPQILEALVHAADSGLHLPLVFNSGGYEAESTLKLLDGVIDIYMPDFKFWDPATAARYAQAPDYPDRARRALAIMHSQVGDLQIDEHGLAVKGLLVRHLVMPNMLDQSSAIFAFLANSISKDTYINIMDQYRPCAAASEYEEINRALTSREHLDAVASAKKQGLHRIDQRDMDELLKRLLQMREK